MPKPSDRERMIRAIKEGGSVLVDGRPVTRVEDLPGVADELARIEAALDPAELASLREENATLKARVAELEAELSAATEPAPASDPIATIEPELPADLLEGPPAEDKGKRKGK